MEGGGNGFGKGVMSGRWVVVTATTEFKYVGRRMSCIGD
jgi:hypothetical protein